MKTRRDHSWICRSRMVSPTLQQEEVGFLSFHGIVVWKSEFLNLLNSLPITPGRGVHLVHPERRLHGRTKGEKQAATHASHHNRTPAAQTQSLIQQALGSLAAHCLAARGIKAFRRSNKISRHVSTPVCRRGQAGDAL